MTVVVYSATKFVLQVKDQLQELNPMNQYQNQVSFS